MYGFESFENDYSFSSVMGSKEKEKEKEARFPLGKSGSASDEATGFQEMPLRSYHEASEAYGLLPTD